MRWRCKGTSGANVGSERGRPWSASAYKAWQIARHGFCPGESSSAWPWRAWSLRPEMLFLDEPSAALDPGATGAIEEMIQAFHDEGLTIVMTTHNLGQARRLADDVIFLHHGRLVEHTPAEEFFTQPRSQAAAAFLKGELLW